MQQRAMLEKTLYNLRFDMDCIGEDLPAEIAALRDAELERLITEYLAE